MLQYALTSTRYEAKQNGEDGHSCESLYGQQGEKENTTCQSAEYDDVNDTQVLEGEAWSDTACEGRTIQNGDLEVRCIIRK